MQRRGDAVTRSLLKTYSDHLLMTNVTVKTHAFFKQSGLQPRFKSVFYPDDYTTLAVIKYAQAKTEADDLFERKHKEIKALIKNNSLDILIFNSLCLHINYDGDIQNKVLLQLEDMTGHKKAKGLINQVYIPLTDASGKFDETPLYGFLHGCLNGFPPRL